MSVDLVVRDLARLSWTRIGHPPHSRVQGKTARSERSASRMPDRTPRRPPSTRPSARLPHLTADHPRPPRLDATPIRSRRTITRGSAPLAADRSVPGSPRTTPGAPPPPPAERDGLGVADDLGPDLDLRIGGPCGRSRRRTLMACRCEPPPTIAPRENTDACDDGPCGSRLAPGLLTTAAVGGGPRTIRAHDADAWRTAFSADGRRLATASSRENSLKLWTWRPGSSCRTSAA